MYKQKLHGSVKEGAVWSRSETVVATSEILKEESMVPSFPLKAAVWECLKLLLKMKMGVQLAPSACSEATSMLWKTSADLYGHQ